MDDATSCVVNALFCEHEDANSYFQLMQGLLRRCGIPLALYTDRHGYSGIHPAPASLGCRPSSAGPWRNWGFR